MGVQDYVVGDELLNVEKKMERGFSNSIMMKELIAKRVKENSQRKPDVSEIRKQIEDQNYGNWEKYLLKQKEIMKKMKMSERKNKEMKLANQEKKMEKLTRAKNNLKNQKSDY